MEAAARDAYTESDERVLSTLAPSMGVALENARLFDETKRLLAETDSAPPSSRSSTRSATALARQLDFDAIIELVGDRVREIFASDVDLRSRSTTRPRT